MDDQNDSNEMEINDGDLLEEANNILSLLGNSGKIEKEEDLFLDDFYVSIIGNLLSDVQPEISPGRTKEEKAEIMNKLIETLSQAIEVDLHHINGAAIILEHDKFSAKNLLDLILELIKTIIDNNSEEEEEEKRINTSDMKNKNDTEKKERHNVNLSESNELNKNIDNYNDENDEEEDNINMTDYKKEKEKGNIIEEINYGEPGSTNTNEKKNINQILGGENETNNNRNLLTNNSTKSNKKDSSKEKSDNKKKEEKSSSKKSHHININNENQNEKDENDENNPEIPNISEQSFTNNLNRSCFEQLDFQKMLDKLKDIENKVDN
jgi:hypothetical protein